MADQVAGAMQQHQRHQPPLERRAKLRA